MALTKNDMAQQVHDKTSLSRIESIAVVDGFFEIIKDELSYGKPVLISGFGIWTVKAKNARKGRNPHTGKSMTIDARKVVTFRASTVLRDAVNKNI